MLGNESSWKKNCYKARCMLISSFCHLYQSKTEESMSVVCPSDENIWQHKYEIYIAIFWDIRGVVIVDMVKMWQHE